MANRHRFRLGGPRLAVLFGTAAVAALVTLAAAPPAAARPGTITPSGDNESATPQPSEPGLVPPVTTPPVSTPPDTIAPTAQTTPPQVELAEPEVITHFVSAPSPTRTRAPAARSTATGAELPNTGAGGGLLMLGSALGAFAIGALALWWGSRKPSRMQAPGPPRG